MIDEIFGHYSLKKFIRRKPVRFGFKQWALCSKLGYTIKFDVCQTCLSPAEF